ncbi:methyltransferase [Streptomyces sp. SCSIO 30461]|uniref:methyltransferase n=1 Tax=Streptomyces sp. SCSIO 30461 TaxID=3118085 RepID=UPI0030D02235
MSDLIEERARVLRARLADELERDGSLRSPEWRRAVERVPRHPFLPRFYRDAPGPDGVTRYTPVSPERDADEWLTLIYRNKTWVTQLDNGATSTDGAPVTGIPTSSSTLPGAVVRMLEDLDVPGKAPTFQAGGGSDYSTGLMCERLGDEFVTRSEYDPVLSAEGRERLASLGYRPRLVTGDAAQGCPEGAPYSRIIATYSPARVPAAWLEQSAPGGLILVSLVGSLDAYGYIKLEKSSATEARGRFINGDVSFMPSREIARPELGPLMRAALDGRKHSQAVDTVLHPQMLDDQGLMWAAQLALPGTKRVGLTVDDCSGRWFLHPDGSWAVLETHPDGSVRAFEGGTRPLWSELEKAATRWLSADRPGLERYGLIATANANLVWLDHPDNIVATLTDA